MKLHSTALILVIGSVLTIVIAFFAILIFDLRPSYFAVEKHPVVEIDRR